MTTRKLHFLAGFAGLLLTVPASAQLTISSGAVFNIQSNAVVTVQGDINSSADITGSGKVLLKGSGNQNVNMNGFSIPNLEVDNTANATLTGNARVNTDLLFTNGKLILGSFNLTMATAPSGTISNANASRYVVTDGSGRLIKTSLGNTAFTFPVGNSATSFNPVSITNSGTADDISVRCLANSYTNGLTGTAFAKETVDATWDVAEGVAGGSNLSMIATWNSTDELSGFQRTSTGISNYVTSPAANVGWDLLNSQTAAATGTNPYSITRTGITTLGAFAVGSRPVLSPLLVSPKVFLQGAYNTSNNLMNDNLRTSNLLPLNEPYAAITGFTHSGSGGGETATAAVVGSGAAAGSDAIVDWVFVQLHRSSDAVVVSTRAALLQRDGDIVDTDGVSPLNMAGNAAGSYYISVRHRNHLGIRTPASFALAKVSTTGYNFTDNIAKAYNNPAITNNPAMPLLAAGVYGMYGGNANSDVSTRVSGSASISDYQRVLSTLGGASILSPVYSASDINMDGVVRVTGTVSISDYQRILSILNSLSILSQHL